MDYKKVRLELRRMRKGDLFNLAIGQKVSKCLIKDVACPLLFQYKKLNFCVSEITEGTCHEDRIKNRKKVLKIMKNSTSSCH